MDKDALMARLTKLEQEYTRAVEQCRNWNETRARCEGAIALTRELLQAWDQTPAADPPTE